MKEEELIKEAESALNELEKKEVHRGQERIEEGPVRKGNPFTIILVVILILLIIMMVVPYYGVHIDPQPNNIPTMQDVKPYGLAGLAEGMPGLPSGLRSNYRQMLVPDHQAIRNMAARIATSSCEESQVCYAKALFFFVRDNFQYVGDPPDDYLESPFETMMTGGADCDGLSILLANLELAVGIPTRFAFIPNHVYVQVKLDDAPKKYKGKDGWISLDPTCNDCGFGEVPYSTLNKQKEYLYTQ